MRKVLTYIGVTLHDLAPLQPAWGISYILMKISDALDYALDNPRIHDTDETAVV